MNREGYTMLKHWINFKPETEQIKTLRTRQGKLALDIHQSLTKTEVKTWLEGTFPIKITGQNICNPKKKQKRRGKNIAYPVRHKTTVITINRTELKLQQKIRKSETNQLEFLKQISPEESLSKLVLEWIQPDRTYNANIINHKALEVIPSNSIKTQSTSIIPYSD